VDDALRHATELLQLVPQCRVLQNVGYLYFSLGYYAVRTPFAHQREVAMSVRSA
jgi:hypothetical protein